MKRSKEVLRPGIDFKQPPLQPQGTDDLETPSKIPLAKQVQWQAGEIKRLKECLARCEAKVQAEQRDRRSLVATFKSFEAHMTEALAGLTTVIVPLKPGKIVKITPVPYSVPPKWTTSEKGKSK